MEWIGRIESSIVQDAIAIDSTAARKNVSTWSGYSDLNSFEIEAGWRNASARIDGVIQC